MSDTAIRVEGLGKEYRIGTSQGSVRYRTIREALIDAVKSPFRRAGRIVRGEGTAAELDETIWALKDVSFTVHHGEVVGIVGRNGAGKSTLLKILSRITEPTEGEAWIHGRVGSLLEVGTGFHPELTGRENIHLSGAILGMKRREIERKFDEIVNFAEIEKFIDTPAKHYSSGMYVRLAFSVAAHLEPEILLVDEVLAVGDAAFQKKCLGKMTSVAGEGRTVLFVSHNMMAVRSLCESAMLIERGHVVERGASEHVVESYLASVDTGDSSERLWNDDAPHYEGVQLISVRVVDRNGRTSPQLDLSDRFGIEVTYRISEEGTTIGTTVLIYRVDGTLVLSSLSNRDRDWHGRRLPRGVFRTVCEVPPNLLNSGGHSVSIFLWKRGYQPILRLDDIIRFEMLEDGTGRGDYLGGWGGAVRPELAWTTEQLAP